MNGFSFKLFTIDCNSSYVLQLLCGAIVDPSKFITSQPISDSFEQIEITSVFLCLFLKYDIISGISCGSGKVAEHKIVVFGANAITFATAFVIG